MSLNPLADPPIPVIDTHQPLGLPGFRKASGAPGAGHTIWRETPAHAIARRRASHSADSTCPTARGPAISYWRHPRNTFEGAPGIQAVRAQERNNRGHRATATCPRPQGPPPHAHGNPRRGGASPLQKRGSTPRSPHMERGENNLARTSARNPPRSAKSQRGCGHPPAAACLLPVSGP